MTRIVWHPEAIRELLRDRKVRVRMEELGELVADRARQRVHVDTGETRTSIHTETVTGPRGIEVRVVADSPAAPFLELGTEHSRPFPFLRPALASIRRGEGGSAAGLGRVRRNKSASKTTARNRAAARARRS